MKNIDELRAWRWDGADLGEAAASSLVTVLRDPLPDLSEHRDLVTATIASAVGAYHEAGRWLERFEPDLVYVFNGRTATTRPLIRACQRMEVRFACHDMGYELGSYRIVPGGMVHDLEVLKEEIHRTWETSDEPLNERRRVGRAFFEGRRSGGGEGAPPERYRFASAQSRGSLPAGFDPEHERNVAIFNSSEDEFAAISEYRNPVYANQMEALEAILSDRRLDGVRFYLRVHPNLAGVDNEQTRRIRAVRDQDNLTVIPPEDPVDTYALMEAVDAVVTFGSTTGVEAVYFEKPAVLIGRALYEDLGCIRPANHEEVVRSILTAEQPGDREHSLRYGYFQRRCSTPFRKFAQETYQEGSFNGIPLEPTSNAETLAKWVWRMRLVVTDPALALARLKERIGFDGEAAAR